VIREPLGKAALGSSYSESYVELWGLSCLFWAWLWFILAQLLIGETLTTLTTGSSDRGPSGITGTRWTRGITGLRPGSVSGSGPGGFHPL